MNKITLKMVLSVAVFAIMLTNSYAKQPPADIGSDAAKYETNLLTKPQRDQLQVEMISLQRDIIAAHRTIDALPEVKAAKDEMLRLRKEKAPRMEIVAASAKYNELRTAEQNKDKILVKKLERYKYVASLLEYDKLRNKVTRARMPEEQVNKEKPIVQTARPVYEVQVAKEQQATAIEEEEQQPPHNVVKLYENSEVFVAGKRVAWSNLRGTLEELYQEEPELELQIDGEVDTPVSKLMEMMKLAREVGFKDVSIRKLF